LVRLRIINQLDAFDREITAKENRFASSVAKLYHKVCAKDATQWARLSVDEILASLSSSKETDDDHTTSRIAVHKLLMADPLHYVARELHRSSLQFSARPRAEVENIKRVIGWIRTNSKELNSFIDKANDIFAISSASRSRTPQGSPIKVEAELPEFTISDRQIILFLSCAIRKHSAHQQSPYEAFAPTIVKKLGVYKKDITGDVIFNFLQDIGVVEPWHDPILLTEERAFSESRVLSELSSGTSDLSQDQHAHIRHDWGLLPVYVIDAADAEELDDGISIERCSDGTSWVHVHVADPTSQLPRSHPIALTAAARGCTIYGPQQTFSMLPSNYAMSHHSLGTFEPEKGQNVLTFSARVGTNGDLIESTVRAGIVHNVHVLTYASVEKSWGWTDSYLRWPFGYVIPEQTGKQVPEEANSDLTTLRDLSAIQSARRVKAGRFSWFIDKARAFFPDKPLPFADRTPQLWSGYPRLVYGVESGSLSPARAMVAEAMVLAGQVAGRFCADRGIPALYRTSGQPVGSYDELPSDILSFNGTIPVKLATKARIAGLPAFYSTSPSDHWPLNVTADMGGYVRVTSPLRRFTDMVMHWQIKAALLGAEKPEVSRQEMEHYASQLHEREAIVKSISLAQNGYWTAIFLQRRLKYQSDDPLLQKLEGCVYSTPEFDTFLRTYNTQVLVPKLGIKGWVSTTKAPGWGLGDTVTVRISDVTMAGKAKVRLEMAE
jgi:exoribonuclease-2